MTQMQKRTNTKQLKLELLLCGLSLLFTLASLFAAGKTFPLELQSCKQHLTLSQVLLELCSYQLVPISCVFHISCIGFCLQSSYTVLESHISKKIHSLLKLNGQVIPHTCGGSSCLACSGLLLTLFVHNNL